MSSGSGSHKQDAVPLRKSMKNVEHNKVVDAYNPYYSYFDERYVSLLLV
uniref:Uncharacterized protein n=1 Tax=Wuchereria bancrofti TaxID=6293 RepID=A0AAF5RUC8_WUCBA